MWCLEKFSQKWATISEIGITYAYATFLNLVLCWMNFVFKNIFWNVISGERQWNLLYY